MLVSFIEKSITFNFFIVLPIISVEDILFLLNVINNLLSLYDKLNSSSSFISVNSLNLPKFIFSFTCISTVVK